MFSVSAGCASKQRFANVLELTVSAYFCPLVARSDYSGYKILATTQILQLTMAIVTVRHTYECSTSCVVPDTVVGELHSVGMLCFLKVLVGMPANVATATDVPADQTNPQVLRRETAKRPERRFN